MKVLLKRMVDKDIKVRVTGYDISLLDAKAEVPPMSVSGALEDFAGLSARIFSLELWSHPPALRSQAPSAARIALSKKLTMQFEARRCLFMGSIHNPSSALSPSERHQPRPLSAVNMGLLDGRFNACQTGTPAESITQSGGTSTRR